jgi:predicted nucleic-acid-binding protein
VRGLDTNILVRFFTEDDPAQTDLAAQMLEETRQRGDRLYVSTIVLCEMVWTLRSKPYRQDRESLGLLLESLLGDELFEIQDRDLVQQALIDYRHGKADFADYLLGWQNWRAGCRDTLTFDGGLRRHQNFSVLSSTS